MDLPSDYRVRAPTAEDLDAVAEVLIAGDLDAAGQRVLDAGFVQAQWSRVGFDLASDAWVVVHRGEAIVALEPWRKAPRPNLAAESGEGRRCGRRPSVTAGG